MSHMYSAAWVQLDYDLKQVYTGFYIFYQIEMTWEYWLSKRASAKLIILFLLSNSVKHTNWVAEWTTLHVVSLNTGFVIDKLHIFLYRLGFFVLSVVN